MGLLRQVHKTHGDFSPVVAVDDADAVGKAHALFHAQTAPGEEQGYIVRRGQRHSKARGDHRPASGGQSDRLVDARLQIHGGRAGGGKLRQGDLPADLRVQGFEFQFHGGYLSKKQIQVVIIYDNNTKCIYPMGFTVHRRRKLPKGIFDRDHSTPR